MRVPATFAIDASGKLVPSSVSSPAFLAVQVSVSDGDGRAHRIVIHTPTPHTLLVPAGGRASVLIPGLRAGQYAVDVDGTSRGALLIGGEPGP